MTATTWKRQKRKTGGTDILRQPFEVERFEGLGSACATMPKTGKHRILTIVDHNVVGFIPTDSGASYHTYPFNNSQLPWGALLYCVYSLCLMHTLPVPRTVAAPVDVSVVSRSSAYRTLSSGRGCPPPPRSLFIEQSKWFPRCVAYHRSGKRWDSRPRPGVRGCVQVVIETDAFVPVMANDVGVRAHVDFNKEGFKMK